MNKRRIISILAGVLACCMAAGAGASDLEAETTGAAEAVAVSDTETAGAAGAAEASIYVQPVKNLPEDFLMGVDISSYLSERESGVVYRDFEGNELDDAGFFRLLADAGVNAVRVRVWNDPYDKDGNSYGGGHNDVETALKLGQLATDAGLRVLIDFHYSDFWADPSKQKSPKEWAHYTLEDKQQALYDFTAESLNTLLDGGVDVCMVQIGNEINNGMAGETELDRKGTLLEKASRAVRDVSAASGRKIQIAVHFTNPQNDSLLDNAQILADQGIDYDVFAVSYYPFWHGTLENLTEKLTAISGQHDKKVMVAETSYVYTYADGDGQGNSIGEDTAGAELNYDVSVQGQANAVRGVAQALADVGDAAVGFFYWEPAWIPVQVYDASAENAAEILAQNQALWEEKGSGWAASFSAKYDPDDAGKYYGGSSWDNQALFDFAGNPLESLNICKYLRTGTTAELAIVRVEDITLESGIGEEVVMPETVPAMMNSGEKQEIPVVWDEAQVSSATDAGAYEIAGTASADGAEYPLTCHLEIKDINYVKNPGFEEADMSMWKIEGAGVSRDADNNILSGVYCLHFWDDEPVDFTVEQEIAELPAGTYELGTNLQGGDAGSNAVFQLYITVNGETQTADTKVSSWQNWDSPVISGIEIPEGAQVTVGVIGQAAAGAWGAWDDFYLYKR